MRKIAIIPNNLKDIGLLNTKKIVNYLIGKAKIYMDVKFAAADVDVNYIEYQKLYEEADIIIALGGDGTILQCAEKAAKAGTPILGINLGRIGFMTEIEIYNLKSALDSLLNGDYTVEKRMMMKVAVKSGDVIREYCHALNDVVVSKSDGARLIGVELYTDGNLVNRYIADGLVIATPTGSTGYSVSAGGPVADPRMSLYIATPICAHTLSARSAVLPSEKQIRIRLDDTYPHSMAIVSADGDVQTKIQGAEEVVITKSEYEFQLIKIGNQSFYDTVLKKLS